jgi:hypothetical protein
MVTSMVGDSYTSPQFAVLATSEQEAIEECSWGPELNELPPANTQIKLEGAQRLCDAS